MSSRGSRIAAKPGSTRFSRAGASPGAAHTHMGGTEAQFHPPERCWSDGAAVGSPVCFKTGSRELLALQARSQIRVERVGMEGRRALLFHQEGKCGKQLTSNPPSLPPGPPSVLASCLAHKAVPPLRSLHEQSGRPGGVHWDPCSTHPYSQSSYRPLTANLSSR